MALVKCPDCGKSVSDKATACNACGCPIGGGGSAGNAAFEKRIEEYLSNGYKIENRNGNTVEMSNFGQKSNKGSTSTWLALIPAILFLTIGMIVLMTVNILFGFLLIILGCLGFIPARLSNLRDSKVIISITTTGKIQESGNVLKNK